MRTTTLALTAFLVALTVYAHDYALRFNGVNQYGIVGEGTNLDLSTGTLEAWVRFDALRDESCLVIRGSSEFAFNYGLYLNYTPALGNYGVWGFIDNDGAWDPATIRVGGTPSPAKRWMHVAITFNATNRVIKFYVDGQLSSTTNYSNATLFNASSLRIGGGLSGWTYLSAELDEVRIWNIERQQPDIANDRYRELTGRESGLVAYYNFNEGLGSTLHDITGNGNDATLVNMNVANWVTSTAFGPYLRIAQDTNGIALSWRSDTTTLYRLERDVSLLAGDWQGEGQVIVGTGEMLTNLFNDVGVTSAFFRLSITNAPP